GERSDGPGARDGPLVRAEWQEAGDRLLGRHGRDLGSVRRPAAVRAAGAARTAPLRPAIRSDGEPVPRAAPRTARRLAAAAPREPGGVHDFTASGTHLAPAGGDGARNAGDRSRPQRRLETRG